MAHDGGKTCAESAIGSFTLPSRAAESHYHPRRKRKEKQEPQLFSRAPLSHIHPPGCCYQETLSLSPCLHTLIIMAFFVCHNSNKKKKRWKKKNPFLQRTRHWVETCTTSIVAGSKGRERAPLVCVLCKVENKKVRPNHWRNGKSQVFCVFFLLRHDQSASRRPNHH